MLLFDCLPTDPFYNTAAVVRRTGVPADTFRAWERRYGLPHPARTESNQRLYSDRDIATITWLRNQTRTGLTISQAVVRYCAHEMPGAPADPEVRPDGSRMTGLRDEVVAAFVDFDTERAERVVEETLALVPVEAVCLHVLQPALYEIGERWARGPAGVDAEHFATAFVLSKLGALFHLSQPGVGRGPLVAACLAGEEHQVGLLLTCLFLSRRGFRVIYLDANLPLDDLLRTIERVQPPLVFLSASLPQSALRLADATRELRERCRELERTRGVRCPKIGYGGQVFLALPELQAGIEGVFLGCDAAEAVMKVETLLADRPA